MAAMSTAEELCQHPPSQFLPRLLGTTESRSRAEEGWTWIQTVQNITPPPEPTLHFKDSRNFAGGEMPVCAKPKLWMERPLSSVLPSATPSTAKAGPIPSPLVGKPMHAPSAGGLMAARSSSCTQNLVQCQQKAFVAARAKPQCLYSPGLVTFLEPRDESRQSHTSPSGFICLLARMCRSLIAAMGNRGSLLLDDLVKLWFYLQHKP